MVNYAKCVSNNCPKYEDCERAKVNNTHNINYWHYCEKDFRWFISPKNFEIKPKENEND